jgi:hypothetical protein
MDSTSSRLTLGIYIINKFCINENDFLPPFGYHRTVYPTKSVEKHDCSYNTCWKKCILPSKRMDGSYTLMLYLFLSFSGHKLVHT